MSYNPLPWDIQCYWSVGGCSAAMHTRGFMVTAAAPAARPFTHSSNNLGTDWLTIAAVWFWFRFSFGNSVYLISIAGLVQSPHLIQLVIWGSFGTARKGGGLRRNYNRRHHRTSHFLSSIVHQTGAQGFTHIRCRFKLPKGVTDLRAIGGPFSGWWSMGLVNVKSHATPIRIPQLAAILNLALLSFLACVYVKK